jgi:hypothetical protein
MQGGPGFNLHYWEKKKKKKEGRKREERIYLPITLLKEGSLRLPSLGVGVLRKCHLLPQALSEASACVNLPNFLINPMR